ncbi:MAG TPA: hypothetical protein VGH60_04535 [Solirubrobacteraceae bacterium]
MIAVVHLVWGPLGIGPLRQFLASYKRHSAGAEHELVVLLNNVPEPLPAELEAALEGVEHRLLRTPKPVLDLAAYAHAADRLEHQRLCFLNSYSEILATDWLAKLNHALDQPRAGLVGATGSWASLHSAVLNAFLLPNPYRRVVPARRVAREQMREIELELDAARTPEGAAPPRTEPPRRTLSGSVVSTLRSFRPMPEQLLRFAPFPAYHVRTNAFMLDRATFAKLHMRPLSRKMDAYLLESGRASFTSQIQNMGLRTLVVARDGAFYDHPEWHAGETFWRGEQQGLLVADNQTRSYANGSYDRRRLLSAFAWGPESAPAPPVEEPPAEDWASRANA